MPASDGGRDPRRQRRPAHHAVGPNHGQSTRHSGAASSRSSTSSAAPASAPAQEIDDYSDLGFTAAVRRLVNFEAVPDDVDSLIGRPGTSLITARGEFLPRTNITDARQRWLFRMVHTRRPLQEKMTLFWHNHFATAYTKIAGAFGGEEGARYMAAKPAEDPQQRHRDRSSCCASTRSATSAIC